MKASTCYTYRFELVGAPAGTPAWTGAIAAAPAQYLAPPYADAEEIERTRAVVSSWFADGTQTGMHLTTIVWAVNIDKIEVVKAGKMKVDTVNQVMTLFAHELTSYDRKECAGEIKRSGRENIYRLGLLFEAMDKVSHDCASAVGLDTPLDKDSARLLCHRLESRFRNIAPVRAIMRKICKAHAIVFEAWSGQRQAQVFGAAKVKP